MSKLTQNYEQLAASLGFRLDAAKNVIYGQRAGFEFIIYAASASYPYMLTVTLGAKFPMGALDKADVKQFIKSVKPIANLLYENNLVTMVMANTPKLSKLCENANISINALIDFLRARGFTPCCQFCGQQVETTGYVNGGSYMHLCFDCAGRLRQDVTLATKKRDSRKENIIGGIVGALLGSVIGIICMIFFSQAAGKIAAVSGFVMAVCTVKGYELLGGKFTKKGIVISILMMIVMTYVGDRLDWAIEIMQYYEVDIFDAFSSVPGMIDYGIISLSDYIANLAMQYILTAVGAVPTIIGVVSARKEEGQFSRIGSADTINYNN